MKTKQALEKIKNQMMMVSKAHKGIQSEGDAWPESGFIAVMEKRSYNTELRWKVL